MLDFGWQELIVIAVVLVLVVGPKDMPKVMRGLMRTVGKMRGMASEFQSAMVEAADVEEVREVKRALQEASSNSIDAFSGSDTPEPAKPAKAKKPAKKKSAKKKTAPGKKKQ